MRTLWASALVLVSLASCGQSTPPSSLSSPTLQAGTQPSFAILYSFHGRADGANPSGVAIDGSGTIYGTTFRGGGAPRQACGAQGCGVAYELSSNGPHYIETVLHKFQGPDAANPISELSILGNALYGTTFTGGAHNLGTVFQIERSSSGYAFSNIFDFTGTSNAGELPTSGVLSFKGALYGAAEVRGCYCSIIYALQNVSGIFQESLVATLQGSLGDYTPATPIAAGQSLFAVNESGGHLSRGCPSGCGTAFQLAGSSALLLHTFVGTKYDGATPVGRLWQDRSGNFFGTTLTGGGNTPACKRGCGVVFKLAPSGSFYSESLVYTFTGKGDGRSPNAIVGDSQERLFGTTGDTVFELIKSNNSYKETTLHTFPNTGGPNTPGGQVSIFGGSLYGALSHGGSTRCTEGCGAIYRMTLPSSQ